MAEATETLKTLAELGERLSAVLEKEFSALVKKDLDLLESLQGQKVELLTQIEQAWQGFDAEPSDDQNALAEVRTLMADCKKGRRPNFLAAAPPKKAQKLCDEFIHAAKTAGIGDVQSGAFGANMQVSLINDGPVTIPLNSDDI